MPLFNKSLLDSRMVMVIFIVCLQWGQRSCWMYRRCSWSRLWYTYLKSPLCKKKMLFYAAWSVRVTHDHFCLPGSWFPLGVVEWTGNMISGRYHGKYFTFYFYSCDASTANNENDVFWCTEMFYIEEKSQNGQWCRSDTASWTGKWTLNFAITFKQFVSFSVSQLI